MAGTAQLDRMAIKLVGDGSHYAKTLDKAVKDTTVGAKKIDRSTKHLMASQAAGFSDVTQRVNSAGKAIDKYGRFVAGASGKVRRMTLNLKALGAKMKSVGGSMRSMGTRMSLGVTLPIVGMGMAAIKMGSDVDTAFAGLRKTVDVAPAQLEAIKQSFIDMIKKDGTPFDLTELLGIGETAGQLGIDPGNIVDFTKVIADLKVTTNMGEDAATNMARFANISGLAQDKFSNLGSSIVALGNSTATTEHDIMRMGLRLAGAGRSVGLTTPQVLGFAAGLSSVGIEAEAGGTAFSKMFLMIGSSVATGGDDLKEFAKVAGMGTEAFSTLFQNDAAGAVTKLLRGLKGLGGAGGILALENMGIKSTRLKDALLRTSGAVDMLDKSMATSNTAFGANTALAAEAAIRYKSFASQVTNLWARIKIAGAGIFKVMEPALRAMINMVKRAVTWFDDLSDGVKRSLVIFGAIVASLGPVLVVLGMLIVAGGAAATALAAIAPALAWIAGAVAGITALSVAAGALAYQIMGPEGIASAWNTAGTEVGAFFTKAKGFIMNLRTNMGILYTFLRKNWRGVLLDLFAAWLTFQGNMVKNALIGVETMFRLWTAYKGWMSSIWLTVFVLDMVAAIGEGIIAGLGLMIDFAEVGGKVFKNMFKWNSDETASSIVGGFIDQIKSDFKKGASGPDLMSTFGDIIGEQFGKLHNPLEGFESSVGLPTFVYGDPDGGDKVAKGLEKTGKVADAMGNAFGTAAKKADKMGKSLGKLNGVETKSAEAMARVGAYLATRQAKQASKPMVAKPMVAAKQAPTAAKGTEKHESKVEELLGTIAESVSSNGMMMVEGANF